MAVTPLIRALIPLAGAAAMLVVPLEVDWHARASIAIATGMILGWITEALHPAILGFVGCFLFRVAGGVEFDTAFAGFGTVTPWFLYGALLLTSAGRRSGLVGALGRRVPAALAASVPAGLIALVAISYGLAFVVPSSLARGVIVVGLAAALAERRGPNRSGHAVLILVAVYSAALFARPDVPSGGTSFTGFTGWDVAAAIAVVCAGALLSVFARTADTPAEPQPALIWTAAAAVPVALGVALWMTTPLHHVPPALVGLGCGLLCCFPGFTTGATKSVDVDHLAVIFCGAALSIPVVLQETKAAQGLAHLWAAGGGAAGGALAYWATAGYRLFSPEGARVQLPSLANALGSTAVWSYAGSTLLSIHQSPALILGWSVARLRPAQVLTLGLAILIAGTVVVWIF